MSGKSNHSSLVHCKYDAKYFTLDSNRFKNKDLLVFTFSALNT